MPPRSSFVDANGVRLRCLEWGEDGPPAVLLHATGFLARLWEPVAETLARRYHVYAYDARGHGDSDKPPGDAYSWDHLTDDFAALLDALGLRDALAIGHSMGGATVVRVAASRPECVSAAVLIEPIVFPPHPSTPGDRRETMKAAAANRRMLWDSHEELQEAYRSRRVFSNWREDVLRLYAEHGTFQREDGRFELKCPGEIEARVFSNSTSSEAWEALPDVRCPTLVMHGERTEEPLAMVARQAAERVANGRLEVLPGAGHLAPMENPEAVAAAIESFTRSLGGAA